MTLLHVAAGNAYGGIERMLVTLGTTPHPELQQEVVVSFSGRLERELESAGVPVHRLPAPRASRPLMVWRARRAFTALQQKLGAGVVVFHSAWPHAMFAASARASPGPLAPRGSRMTDTVKIRGARFRAYQRKDIDSIPELRRLSPEQILGMKAVSAVLPFRVNNYVVEQLIRWDAVPDDPQVKHLNLFTTMDHPKAGTVRAVNVPIQFSATPGAIRRPPPLIGQHGREILAELGYDEAAIAKLIEDRVISIQDAGEAT